MKTTFCLSAIGISRIAKIVAIKAGSAKVYHVDPVKFVEEFPGVEVAWEEERGVWNSTGPNASWACFTIYLRD